MTSVRAEVVWYRSIRAIRVRRAIALLIVLFGNPAAFADPVGRDPWQGVEQLEVVGESNARDLLKAPESIVAFDETDIERFGINDVRDAFRLVPNTNSSPSYRGNNGVTIRGINSEGVSGPTGNLRPLASLVIDGATQSFAGLRRGARGLWDVDRVEIFRGPQSTLQGRNSLAGAILIQTNDPTYHWEGAARASVSNFLHPNPSSQEPDIWDAAFALSGPVIDHQLAFRIAGEIQRDEHGIKATDPNPGDPSWGDLDRGEYQQIRGKLLFEPNALKGLRLEVSAAYTQDDPAVPLVTDRLRRPPSSPGVDPSDPRFAPTRYHQYRLQDEGTNTERRSSSVLNVTGDAQYRVNRDWFIHSVTSWTGTDVKFDTPNPEVYWRPETREDSDFSQDLRATYQPSDDLSVMVGAFFARAVNETDSFIGSGFGGFLFTIQDRYTKRENVSAAFLAEVRWRVFEPLSITAGFRWDHDRYRYLVQCRDLAAARCDSLDLLQFSGSTNAYLPRVTLLYEPIVDHEFGVTISQGYRAGFVSNTSEVDPEQLWNYELSYRGVYLDGRLMVRANAFYYDWADMQVNVGTRSEEDIRNAGSARLAGAEVSIGLEPFDGLSLLASFGYLSTEWIEFKGSEQNEGNEFPESPPFSVSILGAYRHESGWFLAADWSWRDDFFATGSVANDRVVPSYHVLNARMGFELDKVSVSLSVRNVLDKKFLAGRDDFGGTYVGDRRLIGVDTQISF